MRSVLVDTGVLYALVDPDDRYHARAHEELTRLVDERLEALVADSILLESYSLVLRRLNLNVAYRWLDEVRGFPRVSATAKDIDEAARRAKSYGDQRFSLFDLTLAVLSERLNLPVWTFDYDFDVMRVAVWR